MLKPATQRARALRARQTLAEGLLWRRLAAKRLEGLKFKRQQPIGPYVVDFVCFERSLIIEVDGSQHAFERSAAQDRERTSWLQANGYAVLRFWNNDVTQNLEGVIEVIVDAAQSQITLSLPSPIKGEGVR